MFKATKHLNEWHAKGLISADQLQRIEDYEALKNKNPWVFTAILILGAFCVGLGIISVISANWADIPDLVKLGANFLLLSAFGALVYNFKMNDKPVYFEAAATVFVIHCLASIGLISQIYHLKGETYQALGLWLFIVAPLLRYTRITLLPVVWSVGLFMALLDFCNNTKAMDLKFGFSTFVLVLLFACLYEAARFMRHEKWAQAYLISLILSVIPSVFAMERLEPYRLYSLWFWLPVFVLVLMGWGLIYKSQSISLVQKRIKYSMAFTYLLMFLFYLTQTTLEVKGVYKRVPVETWQEMVNSLFTLALLSQIALYLISLKRVRAFNWIVVLIGLRLYILFYQALGGLALSGIGLIISGLIVILLTYAWSKNRSRLADRIQGWILNEK